MMAGGEEDANYPGETGAHRDQRERCHAVNQLCDRVGEADLLGLGGLTLGRDLDGAHTGGKHPLLFWIDPTVFC